MKQTVLYFSHIGAVLRLFLTKETIQTKLDLCRAVVGFRSKYLSPFM